MFDEASPTAIAGNPLRRNFMSTALWIVAGLLAAVFLFAGSNKLFISREKLAKAPGGGWVLDFSAGFVKALGTVEILGAVGLIVPALLDIAPILVPLAALGLGLVMTGAAIVEFRRREFKHVLLDLIYLALAVFVAVGRFGPQSFTS
jgi:DoxX-like family